MDPIPDSVLVVDDDPGTRRSIQRILSLDGYRIESLPSAARLFQERDWRRYFAVLLDRRLEDGTAEEIIPRLREQAPQVNIIVITGYGDLTGAVAALREGVADYILKPIQPDELRFRLRQLLEGRRTRDENRRQRLQQAVQAEISLQALRLWNLDELYRFVCEKLTAVMEMEFCKMLRLAPQRDVLRLVAGVGWPAELIGQAVVPNDPGIQAGYALRCGEAVVAEDLLSETRFQPSSLLRDYGIRSGIVVPISDGVDHIGVLGIHSAAVHRFTRSDVDFLQSVANLLGTAAQRHRAEQELDRFFELSQELSCILTLTGEFVRTNSAWERTLDHDRSELAGLSLQELCHPGDRPAFQAVFEELKNGIPLKEISGRFRARNRSYRWLEWNATPDLPAGIIHAVARDITAARQAAELIRQERDFARSLIDTARALIVLVDEAGQIVRWNSYAEELTGSSLSEVQGTLFQALFHRIEDQTAWLRLFRQARSAEFSVETCLRGQDRGERQVKWWGRPIRQQEVRFVLLVGHDLTELKRTQEKLLRNERLSAIGQMVTGLAHESRNSLQRAQASLEMLALDLGGNPEFAELIRQIQQALSDLHRLYEEVRGYAAPLTLERHAADLRQLCDSVWQELRISHEPKRIRLHLFSRSLPDCELDIHRMAQVLRNVLENAIIACPERGEVFIEGQAVSLNSQPAVQLVIRDTGPGMSPEQAAQIFEPFYTTRTHGTGLGMAIARRIVEAHNGVIEVGACRPGAEIRIALPVQSFRQES